MKKPVSIQDFYRFKFPSFVRLSPDGKLASFTVTQMDEQANAYNSYLYVSGLEGNWVRQLSFGGKEKNAVWLDATTLLFSAPAKDAPKEKDDGAPLTVFYTIDVGGGEAQELFRVEQSVGSIAPLGPGRFLLSCNCPVEAPQKSEEGAPKAAVQGKDFEIFEELPFWFNARGVVNRKRNRLALYEQEGGTLTFLTGPWSNVQSFSLSPSKSLLAYSASTYEDVSPRGNALCLYSFADGTTRELFPAEGKAHEDLAFLDEDSLFYTRTGFEWPGRNPDYLLYRISEGKELGLLHPDAPIGNSVGTDSSYGGGAALKASGGQLYFLTTDWSSTKLNRLTVDGEESRLSVRSRRDGAIACLDVVQDVCVFVGMRDRQLGEVYSLNLNTGEELRLSSLNNEFTADVQTVAPDYFTFRNRDDVELEGYVLKPLDFDPKKVYPGVLEMHGGPKVSFGGIYHHEMQCLSAKGYFVFYTNPRGSDGRGEAFANITCNLGNLDFNDFMDFTDEVIRRYPQLDPCKIGICGGSYGGFMCNWMIGHTDRFAAAASQRSISNYFTKALTTDIGFNHNMSQLGTTPWKDFDTFWRTSPLSAAPTAKTPTLFIQSDEDYRCWMSDALQMYSALKLNGTPTKLCLFHGENHELSRSGKPKNRVYRLQEIFAWFDQYLKGE